MPSKPAGERRQRAREDWQNGPLRSAIKRAETGPRCERCGHTLWFHQGLREPGCVWLGACDCPEFVEAVPETA